mgnify:CR=1 FL=1
MVTSTKPVFAISRKFLLVKDLIFWLKFYHSKWWSKLNKKVESLQLADVGSAASLHDHVRYFCRLGFPKKSKVCTMGFMVWNKTEFVFWIKLNWKSLKSKVELEEIEKTQKCQFRYQIIILETWILNLFLNTWVAEDMSWI